MQGKSNLRQIASVLFENNNGAVNTSSKEIPASTNDGLKRKGELDAFSGRSRSDASSDGIDAKTAGDIKRSAGSISDEEDDTEFFECEQDDERSPGKRLSVESASNKRKSERRESSHLLLNRVQGPPRLRYWDSADHHMALPRTVAGSM